MYEEVHYLDAVGRVFDDWRSVVGAEIRRLECDGRLLFAVLCCQSYILRGLRSICRNEHQTVMVASDYRCRFVYNRSVDVLRNG